DFNGDGKDDLLVINSLRDVYVKLSTGDSMEAPVRWGSIGTNIRIIGVGDRDGNGADDLIYASLASRVWGYLQSDKTTFTPLPLSYSVYIPHAGAEYFIGEAIFS
ncbi:MAG: VCBS repeat-containing protein, partial [Planctomycetaceae bacterium]|nr:VCBS repeat-containing protein [Planctomycetaceae bacterium]